MRNINPNVGMAIGVLIALLGFSVLGYSLFRRTSSVVPGAGSAPAAAMQSDSSDPARVHDPLLVALRDGNRPQALATSTMQPWITSSTAWLDALH